MQRSALYKAQPLVVVIVGVFVRNDCFSIPTFSLYYILVIIGSNCDFSRVIRKLENKHFVEHGLHVIYRRLDKQRI